MTDTLTVEETKTAEPGDHDRLSHYYPLAHIEEAIFTGRAREALCGKIDVPTRDFTKHPVCPECKEAYDALPD